MARRIDDDSPAPRRRSPAKTPDESEAVLVAKSLKLIEKQIDEGSVSSQALVHFAKLGSSRERLEQERLRNENEVLRKKVETMEAAVDVRNLMQDALQAFRGYSGDDDSDFDDY